MLRFFFADSPAATWHEFWISPAPLRGLGMPAPASRSFEFDNVMMPQFLASVICWQENSRQNGPRMARTVCHKSNFSSFWLARICWCFLHVRWWKGMSFPMFSLLLCRLQTIRFDGTETERKASRWDVISSLGWGFDVNKISKMIVMNFFCRSTMTGISLRQSLLLEDGCSSCSEIKSIQSRDNTVFCLSRYGVWWPSFTILSQYLFRQIFYCISWLYCLSDVVIVSCFVLLSLIYINSTGKDTVFFSPVIWCYCGCSYGCCAEYFKHAFFFFSFAARICTDKL